MKITKILAAILILCLTFTMFVSCDNDKGKKSQSKRKDDYGDEKSQEEQETFSQGLNFEVSEDRTYFIVKDLGTCKDTKVVVPSTYQNLPVKEIGYGVFGGGSFVKPNVPRVSEVILPNSIVKIGHLAFGNNNYLTKIKFGNSITSIDDQAFINCDNIKEVHIPSVKKWCDIDFFASDSSPFNASPEAKLYVNNSQITDLVINDVSNIKKYTFYGCGTIETLSVGSSVQTIGIGAFARCNKLTSVVIGESVTKIDGDLLLGNAFSNCDTLLSVKFADAKGWTASGLKETVKISSAELSNTATAAQYISDKYSHHAWTKK